MLFGIVVGGMEAAAGATHSLPGNIPPEEPVGRPGASAFLDNELDHVTSLLMCVRAKANGPRR